MTVETLLYALTVALGWLMGLLTSGHSQRHKAISGGWLAHGFHYVAASTFTTLSLTVPLLSVGKVLGVSFPSVLAYLLSLGIVLLLSLFGYARVEYTARLHPLPEVPTLAGVPNDALLAGVSSGTPRSARIQRNARAALGLGLCVIYGLATIQLVAPGSLSRKDRYDGADVRFSADRGMVFAPGNCVVVEWQVDGAREVYLDRDEVIETASTVLCVTPTTLPVLRVVFADGTTRDYRLNITFFMQQPGSWLLAFLTGLLVVTSLTSLLGQRLATTTNRPRPFARGLIGVFLLTGAGLLLTAVVLELGLRFYFSQFGTQTDKVAYLYSRAQINQLEANAMPLPEIDYGLSPDQAEHNRLGYRGAEIAVPKPDGVFRIIALGGSTTYGTPVRVDETYPYDLQQILRAGYGYSSVEVLNAGVYGYTSYQTLANLTFRIPELGPDLVIIYDNANDILTREVNPDCYRGQNPLLGLDPRGRVATSDYTQPVSPSTLYRFLTTMLGLEPNPAQLESFFTTVEGHCGDGKPYSAAEEVAANPPTYFERNLISMIGIARIHDFQIVLATWPYQESSSEPPPFWRAAVAEQNDVLRRVAKAYNVPLIDYAPAAPQQAQAWADYVHMSADGSHDQAAFFARYLVEHGLIRPTNVG